MNEANVFKNVIREDVEGYEVGFGKDFGFCIY